jgi:hypothetical protein
MRNSVYFLSVIALALTFAPGCARQAEVVKIYDKTGDSVNVYKRLLVVDVSSDPNRQQIFEDEIVDQLRDKHVEGVVAHTKLRFEGGVPQKKITAYGNAVGADGILVTRFVSVESTVVVEEGRTEIRSSCRRGSLVDYFLYDHDVIREPDSVRSAYEVVVVSSLYDVATRKRVWSIQSTCFDKSSMLEVLLDEARVIVEQLRIDELI